MSPLQGFELVSELLLAGDGGRVDGKGAAGGRAGRGGGADSQANSPGGLRDSEEVSARALQASRDAFEWHRPDGDDDVQCTLELDESQQASLKLALGLPLCRIKGARGTGKTRVALQIARCFALRNRRAAIARPPAAGRCRSSEMAATTAQLHEGGLVLVCVPSGAEPSDWAHRFQREAEGGGGREAAVRVCWYSDGRMVAGRSTEGKGCGGSGSAEVLCCRGVDAHEAVVWMGKGSGALGAPRDGSRARMAVSQVVVDDCCLMWEMECLLPILMLDGAAAGEQCLIVCSVSCRITDLV